jgi:hypothetical protein
MGGMLSDVRIDVRSCEDVALSTYIPLQAYIIKKNVVNGDPCNVAIFLDFNVTTIVNRHYFFLILLVYRDI